MRIEVPALSLEELDRPSGETSAQVASRVLAAREIQEQRFGEAPVPANAAMSCEQVHRLCVFEAEARRLLDTAFDRLKLSARAVTQILKVARTVADLDSSERITAVHMAEAIQYRSFPRRGPKF